MELQPQEPITEEKLLTPAFWDRLRQVGINRVLLDIEKKAIVVALSVTDGNKSQAARILGIKRSKLLMRMKTMHGMPLLDPYRKGEPRAKLKEPEIQS